MEISRRNFCSGLAVTGIGLSQQSPPSGDKATRYVRYENRGKVSYGLLDGETIKELRGDLFESKAETGTKVPLSAVKLLCPCEPTKVLAVGLNYKSHLGDRPAPEKPELFFKPLTSLQNPAGQIVIPPGAKNVHYEGEMVIVIGKRAQRIPAERAADHIFGYTCGNDVTERDWQRGDLQWWRAKGSDTFGPLGPVIVSGLDYKKSRLQTRLNGEVKQSQLLSDLIFDAAAIVSFASQYVTLERGDVIYTGTPGATSAMKPGDLVEIEIEGIGILGNRIAG
ncbi:MAG TPA: fumarylacetoacetate hydrolase family protein [Blastocatellia bacterium]|nr:fumarylacetoacetate hydrolase family protein [Blastocatellia bacterium]